MEKAVDLHPVTSTPGISPVLPNRIPKSEECEIALHIGLFFDGTGNNRDWDGASACQAGRGSQASRLKDSNVARLFYAYPDAPNDGYYRMYVAGVGTPFPPIGEIEPATFGMAAGAGGDGRINFGLLYVLNSIHTAISPTGQPAFDAGTVTALCRNNRRVRYQNRGQTQYTPLNHPGDAAALRAISMEHEGGLLGNRSGSRPQASAFFNREAARIAELAQGVEKPKVIEIFVDVFGFSRGAAQARVFCSWLNEIFQGNTLCGIPAKVRMLGIFDTVASVGVANNPTLTHNLTNGHMAWARPEWLQIAPCVENCVHYIAMHENRGSFPLDRIHLPNGNLPPGCHEFAFPGMHSDVGGGYEPDDQGRGRLTGAAARDSEKLSQVPLKRMLDAAKDANVPLDADAATRQSITGADLFAVDDGLEQAFAAFLAVSTPTARAPREWLFTYLAWRYQVLDSYDTLPWRDRAPARDRNDLIGANDVLKADIRALDSTDGVWNTVSSYAQELVFPWARSAVDDVRKLAPEARELLDRMRDAPTVSEAEATMFGIYAHDSYAGFRPFDTQFDLIALGCRDIIPGSWEPEGYLRYRRFYIGNNEALTFNLMQDRRVPGYRDETTRWAAADGNPQEATTQHG